MYNNGNKLREVGATLMNKVSSRSHAIFSLFIESKHGSNDNFTRVSTLHMVDLAGNEQLNLDPARRNESKAIKDTLYFLSNIVRKLSEGKEVPHHDYRNSKLTELLSAALGGNSITAFVCTVDPSAQGETDFTLR